MHKEHNKANKRYLPSVNEVYKVCREILFGYWRRRLHSI